MHVSNVEAAISKAEDLKNIWGNLSNVLFTLEHGGEADAGQIDQGWERLAVARRNFDEAMGELEQVIYQDLLAVA